MVVVAVVVAVVVVAVVVVAVVAVIVVAVVAVIVVAVIVVAVVAVIVVVVVAVIVVVVVAGGGRIFGVIEWCFVVVRKKDLLVDLVDCFFTWTDCDLYILFYWYLILEGDTCHCSIPVFVVCIDNR